MKEHPILFSTEMVKAILEGRKTQTRRVMKTLPYQIAYPTDKLGGSGMCPYGEVGDGLWVRETFAHYGDVLEKGLWFALVTYKANGVNKRIPFAHTTPPQEKWWNTGKPLDYWQPSIFMPRWASRITLEITGLKAERLQEITLEDIWDEGIRTKGHLRTDDFMKLWDSINAKRGYSWKSNPWVWVIEFKVI